MGCAKPAWKTRPGRPVTVRKIPASRLSAPIRRPALALTVAGAIAFPLAAQAQGRGPDKIADVAEAVIDAVVNISTSQPVTAGGPTRPERGGPGTGPGPEARPQLP